MIFGCPLRDAGRVFVQVFPSLSEDFDMEATGHCKLWCHVWAVSAFAPCNDETTQGCAPTLQRALAEFSPCKN